MAIKAQDLNSVAGNGSILDSIWSTARGTFDRVVSFKLEQEDLKRLERQRRAQIEIENNRQERLSFSNFTNTVSQSPKISMATIGLIGLALIVIMRK